MYNADGKPLEGVYEDLNKDGVINTSDQYFYKSPDPNITLGFNTSFSYKNGVLQHHSGQTLAITYMITFLQTLV